MGFEHVLVVGAGQMGAGIAQVVAASGRRVSLHDAAPGAVERGLESMQRSLAKLAEKGGPDPADVGGIAELKWIAEYADLHGISVAPHGIFDGLIGLAAHVHLAAVMPQNYIAFEYPYGQPEWWYDIVDGLPDPIVNKGFVDVWDRPGLGVTFNVAAAKAPVARFGITLPSDRPLAVETAAAARQAARPSVVVVQNWFEELNAKLPATP